MKVYWLNIDNITQAGELHLFDFSFHNGREAAI